MAYRVIQWGTGAVGKHTLRAVLDHPQLELVGLKVYNESKVGRDAGELADRPATGIRAVREMAQLPLAAADRVLSTCRCSPTTTRLPRCCAPGSA